MSPLGHFASSIAKAKYFWNDNTHNEVKWEDVCRRVIPTVMRARPTLNSQLFANTEYLTQAMIDRKFMPGGRYCYATGRPFHQTQNCVLMRAHDSREGWAELMQKGCMSLMTGAGVGVAYGQVRHEGAIIRKTGGFATGPIALMQMFNESGRGIMQGGSRRAAIWAGLPWWHGDVHKFIRIKDWSPEIRALKEKDFSFPAMLDHTNISVQLDDAFFAAYKDEKHRDHNQANAVYWAVVEQMLKTAEPGFSIDVGENAGEELRNACVTGDTRILTSYGYTPISEVVGHEVKVWNGSEWSIVTPTITGYNRKIYSVLLSDGRTLDCTSNHKFVLKNGRQERLENLNEGDKLLKVDYPVITGGDDVGSAYTQGFISAEGMDDYPWFWVYNTKYVCMSRLMATYGNENQGRVPARPTFNKLPKSFVPSVGWSVKSRLDWLAGLIDGDGTGLKRSGVQIASVDYGFLLDVQSLLTTLGANSKIRIMRNSQIGLLPDGKGGEKEYPQKALYRLLIPGTEIKTLVVLGIKCERVNLEDSISDKPRHKFTTIVSIDYVGVADKVYCFTEPKRNQGCFNGIVTGQCTEVTSRDSDDVCNLASINLGNVETLKEFKELVRLGTEFLLAGTIYSDVPHLAIDVIRAKNRRLGLGLMGIHEWLLKRGYPYGPCDELADWLFHFYDISRRTADNLADDWRISRPAKVLAIAPNGTIGIVAETSTGIEPIFCVAYKRRYLKDGKVWVYQYVIDPVAKRLIEQGIKPEAIEDAYSLAQNVERRVEFQAFVQDYIDHGISSTINLPHWGHEFNNSNLVRPFGDMLMKYLPRLRGVTCYPDGARGGQPLTPVNYKTAIKHEGAELVEETVNLCDITGRGSCGE